MKILCYITGLNLDKLINYFDNVSENDIIEHTVDGIWFKQQKPNPFTIISITMLLIFSFLVPLQTISLTFKLPPSIAVSITYPPILFVMVLNILAMKSVLKGRKWTILVFKYVFFIDCLLLLLSLYLSFSSDNIHWQLLIIPTCMLLWCRILLNCASFSSLIKFYLHRKLVANDIGGILDKTQKRKNKP